MKKITHHKKESTKTGLPYGYGTNGTNVTMNQALEDFPNFLRGDGKSHSTMVAYKSDMKHFKHFLEVTLKNKIRYVNNITTVEIIQYKDSMLNEVDRKTLTLSTAWRRYNCLKTFFRYLDAAKYAENIMKDDKFGNKNWNKNNVDNFLPGYLTTSELKQVIEPTQKSTRKNKYRDIVMLLILVYFGCRRGDLLRLRWSDVDLYKKTIKLTRLKTYNADELPLPEMVEEALIKYMSTVKGAATGYLFPARNGGSMANSTISRILKTCIDESGLELEKGFKIVPHTFRHSFITFCVQNDFSGEKIIKYTGHCDERSLKPYTHLRYQDVMDVANALAKSLS